MERKLTEDAEVIEQEVMAEVAGDVSPEQLQRLCHGLSFNGRPLPPVKVSVSSRNDAQTRLRFALKGIRPGRCPSCATAWGLRLLALKRIRLGPLARWPSCRQASGATCCRHERF
jgi:23S rRNA pseudouridine2604 synthase